MAKKARKTKNFLTGPIQFKIQIKLLEDWQRILNERPTTDEVAEQMATLFNCEVTGANINTCCKAIEKEWPKRRSPMAADAAIEATALQVAEIAKSAKIKLIPEFAAMLKS
jgi:hypothetical protein